jgi:hypothetical protein
MGERVALPPYFQYVGVQCVGPMAGAGGRSRGPRSYLQITVDLPVSYFPRGLEAVAGLRVGGCSSYSRPTRTLRRRAQPIFNPFRGTRGVLGEVVEAGALLHGKRPRHSGFVLEKLEERGPEEEVARREREREREERAPLPS